MPLSPERELYEQSVSSEMLQTLRAQAKQPVYIARLAGGTQYAVHAVTALSKERLLLISMLCGEQRTICRGVEIDTHRKTATLREPTDAELRALERGRWKWKTSTPRRSASWPWR